MAPPFDQGASIQHVKKSILKGQGSCRIIILKSADLLSQLVIEERRMVGLKFNLIVCFNVFSSVQKVFIVNPHTKKTYNGQTYTVIGTMLNKLLKQ